MSVVTATAVRPDAGGHRAAADRGLRIRLLGPVRLIGPDGERATGSAKQRLVLAVLALHAGRVVSRQALIDAVWGEDMPDSAEDSLYTYVSRLRKVLDPYRSGRVLVTEGRGYRLDPAAVEIDVEEFARLGDLARRLGERDDPHGAADVLERALSLWHGDPLEDVQGAFASAERDRLTELRLRALEQRAAALVRCGRATEVAAELRPLVAEHPMREELTALLMLALHEQGRSAEAVEVFDRVETVLVEQQGLTPGGRLRELRERFADTADHGALACRSAARSALRRRLTGLRSGRGGVVWIEGGPGIGKSALLSAGLAGVEETGCVVFRLTAEPGVALTDLLHDVWHAATGTSAPPPTEIVGGLRELCRRGPVLLSVDDIHLLDPGGVLAWRRLVRLAADQPLLLVAAGRPEENQPCLCRSAETAEVLRLEPLDIEGVTEFVTVRTGATPGARLLDAVGCAGGNPGRLAGVLTALDSASLLVVADGRVELGAGPHDRVLREVVQRWLAALSPPGRRLVRTAALLGSECDLDDLIAVAGQPLSDLSSLLGEAAQHGFLRESGHRLAFPHTVLWDGVAQTWTPSEKPLEHREAARALDRAGALPDHVAGQLLLAALPPDDWTIRWLLAYVKTLAAESPMLAVELLNRSLDWPGMRTGSRVVLTTLLVRLLWRQGRRPLNEAAFVERTTTDPEVLTEMRLVTAHLHHDAGETALARDALRRLLGAPGLRARWRVRAESLRAQIDLAEDGDLNSARAELRRTDRGNDAFAAAHTRHALWRLRSRRGDHRAALAHAQAGIVRATHEPEAIELELGLWGDKVFSLQQLDRLEEAGRALATARALATGRGITGGAALPAAAHWYWLGRWDDAIAELEYTLYDGYHCMRSPGVFQRAQGLRAVIAGHRDDAVGLETILKRMDTGAAAYGPVDYPMVGKAIAAEQAGRPADALAILEPLLSPETTGTMAPHQYLPRLARLARDVGDRPALARAVTVCRERSASERVPARARTALWWCTGLAASDPGPVLRAADRLAGAGRRVEHAMALEDASVLLARAGDLAEAERHGRRAMGLYAEIGALWDLRRAETALGGFGIGRPDGRRPSPDRLSRTEYRVAELVAAGWSNHEIRLALSLPRDAVQDLVLGVVAKTGAGSRLAVTPDLVKRFVSHR
ncbi:BTAD domain-containing putative transcriptional regulator [Actinoallomurus acaciae]|uniref:BTAD domain-containing putative transcriptional regulator n=1 Tax=Actinoallomurus acaciae TaxID=502577 RepID=A0ABV5YMG4_9ACTN